MRFLILGILAVLLCFPAYAGAQKQSSSNAPNPPELIQSLVAQGAQIRYLGNDLGYNGWLGVRAGQVQYFYADPKTGAIFTGILFDQKGKPITFQQITRLQEKEGGVLDVLTGASDQIKQIDQIQNAGNPDPAPEDPAKPLSKSEKLIRSFEAANWVPLGAANAPIVYMVIDPNCPHCHDQILDLKAAALENGKIQLRIIPVGVLGPDSLKQAAYLLATQDAGSKLISALESKTALPVQNDINTQAVQKNMALMVDYKLDATPVSVYRSKAGQVKIVVGRAKDSSLILNDLP